MTTRPDAYLTKVRFDEDVEEDRETAVVYQCQMRWDDLALTATGDVRYCTNCEQRVYTVRDRAGLARCISEGHCVRIPFKGERFLLGAPLYDYMTFPRLKWDE